MIRHDFPGVNRASTILNVDRIYGVGIGGASEHGIAMVDGYPIGPRAPLIFDGGQQTRVGIALPSFYRGNAQVLVATCPQDIGALCCPRAPRYQHFAVTTAAETDLLLAIPFHGRSRLYAKVWYTGAGTPVLGLSTLLRHYWGTGVSDYDEDQLNHYGEASIAKEDATGLEETERGDELVLRLNTDTPCDFRVTVWAHDEGT